MTAPSSMKFRFVGKVKPKYFTNVTDPNFPTYLKTNTNTFVSKPGVIESRGGYIDEVVIPECHGHVYIAPLDSFVSQNPINPELESKIWSHHEFTTKAEFDEFCYFNFKPPVKQNIELNKIHSDKRDVYLPPIPNAPDITEYSATIVPEVENQPTYVFDILNTGFSSWMDSVAHEYFYDNRAFLVSPLASENTFDSIFVAYTHPRFKTKQVAHTSYTEVPGQVIRSRITDFTTYYNTPNTLLAELAQENKDLTRESEDNFEFILENLEQDLRSVDAFNQLILVEVSPDSLGFKEKPNNWFQILNNPEYIKRSYRSETGGINNLRIVERPWRADGVYQNEENQVCTEYHTADPNKLTFFMVTSAVGSPLKQITKYVAPELLHADKFQNVEKVHKVFVAYKADDYDAVKAIYAAGDTPTQTTQMALLYTAQDAQITFPLHLEAQVEDLQHQYFQYEEIIPDPRLLPTVQDLFMRKVDREIQNLFNVTFEPMDMEKTEPLFQPNLYSDNDQYMSIRSTLTLDQLYLKRHIQVYKNLGYLLSAIGFFTKKDATIMPIEMAFADVRDTGLKFYAFRSSGNIFMAANTGYAITDFFEEGNSHFYINTSRSDQYYINHDATRVPPTDGMRLYSRPEWAFNDSIDGKQVLHLSDKYSTAARRTRGTIGSRQWVPFHPFGYQNYSLLYKYLTDSTLRPGAALRVFKIDESKLGTSSNDFLRLVIYRHSVEQIRTPKLWIFKKTFNSTASLIDFNIDISGILDGTNKRCGYTLMYKKAATDVIFTTLDQALPPYTGTVRHANIRFLKGSLYLLIIPSSDEDEPLYEDNLHIVYPTIPSFITMPQDENHDAVYYLSSVDSLPNYLDCSSLDGGINNEWFSEPITTQADLRPLDLTLTRYTDDAGNDLTYSSMSLAMWELHYFPLRIFHSAKEKSPTTSHDAPYQIGGRRDMVDPNYLHKLDDEFYGALYTEKDLKEIKMLPLHSKVFEKLMTNKDYPTLTFTDWSSQFSSTKFWLSRLNFYLNYPAGRVFLSYRDPMDNDLTKTISLNLLFDVSSQDTISTKYRERNSVAFNELNKLFNGHNPMPFRPMFKRTEKMDVCIEAYNTGRHFLVNTQVVANTIVTPNPNFEPLQKYHTTYSKRKGETLNKLHPYDLSECYLAILPCGYESAAEGARPLYPQDIKIWLTSTHDETQTEEIDVIETVERPDYGDGVIDVKKKIVTGMNARHNAHHPFDINTAINHLKLTADDTQYFKGFTTSTSTSNKIAIRVGDLLKDWQALIKTHNCSRLQPSLCDGTLGQMTDADALQEFTTNVIAHQKQKAISFFDTFSVHLNSSGDFTHPLLRVAKKTAQGELQVVPYANTLFTPLIKSSTDEALLSAFNTAQNSGGWSYFGAHTSNEYDLVKNTWSRANSSTSGYISGHKFCNYLWKNAYPFYARYDKGITLTTAITPDFLSYELYDITTRHQNYGSFVSTILWADYFWTMHSSKTQDFMQYEYDFARRMFDYIDTVNELCAVVVLNLTGVGSLVDQIKDLTIVRLDLPNVDANYLPPIIGTKKELSLVTYPVSKAIIEGSLEDYLGHAIGRTTSYTSKTTFRNEPYVNPINWTTYGFELINWQTARYESREDFIRIANTFDKRIYDQDFDMRFFLTFERLFIDRVARHNSSRNGTRSAVSAFGKNEQSITMLNPNLDEIALPLTGLSNQKIKWNKDGEEFIEDVSNLAQPLVETDAATGQKTVIRESIQSIYLPIDHNVYHEFAFTDDKLNTLAPNLPSIDRQRQMITPNARVIDLKIGKDTDADGNERWSPLSGAKFSPTAVDLMPHNPGQAPIEESLEHYKFLNIGPFFPITEEERTTASLPTSDMALPLPFHAITSSKHEYAKYPDVSQWDTNLGTSFYTIGKYLYKEAIRINATTQDGTSEYRFLVAGLFDTSNIGSLSGETYIFDSNNLLTSHNYVWVHANDGTTPNDIEMHFIAKTRKLSATPYVVDVGLILKFALTHGDLQAETVDAAQQIYRPRHVVFEPTSAFSNFPHDRLDKFKVLPDTLSGVDDYIESGVVTRLDMPQHIVDKLMDTLTYENGRMTLTLQNYWAIYDFKPTNYKSQSTATICISNSTGDITAETDDVDKAKANGVTVIKNVNFSKQDYVHQPHSIMYDNSLTFSPPGGFDTTYSNDPSSRKYDAHYKQGYPPVNIVSPVADRLTMGDLGFALPVNVSGLTITPTEQKVIDALTPYMDGTIPINSTQPLKISVMVDKENAHGVKNLKEIQARNAAQNKFFVHTNNQGAFIVNLDRKFAMPVDNSQIISNENLSTVQKGSTILVVNGTPVQTDDNTIAQTGDSRLAYYKIFYENPDSTKATMKKVAVEFEPLSTDADGDKQERNIGDWVPQKIFFHKDRTILIDPLTHLGKYIFLRFKSESDAVKTVNNILDDEAPFSFDLPHKETTLHVVLFNDVMFTFTKTTIYAWTTPKYTAANAATHGLIKVVGEDIVINKDVKPEVIHNRLFFVTASNVVMFINVRPYRAHDYQPEKFDECPFDDDFEIKQLSGGVINGQRILTILGKNGEKYIKNLDLEFSETTESTPSLGYSRWVTKNRTYNSVHNTGEVMLSSILDKNQALTFSRYSHDETIDVIFAHHQITLRQLQDIHNNRIVEQVDHTNKNLGIPLYYKSDVTSGLIGDIFTHFDTDLVFNFDNSIDVNTDTQLFKNNIGSLDDDICSIGYGIEVIVETLAMPNIDKLLGYSRTLTHGKENVQVDNILVTIQDTDTFHLFIDDIEFSAHRTLAAFPEGVTPELSQYALTSATVKLPINKSFRSGQVRIEHETTNKFKMLTLAINLR